MTKKRTLGKVGIPIEPQDIANKEYVDSISPARRLPTALIGTCIQEGNLARGTKKRFWYPFSEPRPTPIKWMLSDNIIVRRLELSLAVDTPDRDVNVDARINMSSSVVFTARFRGNKVINRTLNQKLSGFMLLLLDITYNMRRNFTYCWLNYIVHYEHLD